jgi:outer membrane translocation and assembly module TamA
MLHELSVAVGVGVGEELVYGRGNATARFYQSIYEEYLVFAARVMGDVLFGEVPFYELARAGGLTIRDAPGGAEGVRGVPAQRYHGKLKLIGNVELRSKLWWFEIFGQRLNLGAAAFFDAGRVWTDWQEHPELDGAGLGLKYGTGGGVRFQWGETFIARIDGAWSPDGIGFYVEAYHIF